MSITFTNIMNEYSFDSKHSNITIKMPFGDSFSSKETCKEKILPYRFWHKIVSSL